MMRHAPLKLFAAFAVMLLCCFSWSTVVIDSYSEPGPASFESGNRLDLPHPMYSSAKNEDLLLAILGTDERGTEKSRSDVLMLVKYKAAENKLILISIPRDSKVSIPGWGISKINAATAFGGCQLQVRVLEELFEVSGVQYIHINFVGFRKVIDAVGGVEINAKKDFAREEEPDKPYAKKGKNLLMGEDLLAYVRFRHDEDGDFGRINRQQEVLRALTAKLLMPDQLYKLPAFGLIVAQNTDSDMDIFLIMKRLKQLKKLDSMKFEFYTLKTSAEKSNGIWYENIDNEYLDSIKDLLGQ